MLYSVLITLHAAAGVAAFVAGWLALAREQLLPIYQGALLATSGFLVLAVGGTAAGRSFESWIITVGLLALGGVMFVQSLRATTVRPALMGTRTPAYMRRIGFGLVGLFDAFWVIALLRVGLSGWSVTAVAVAIALGGHLVLARAEGALHRSAAM